MQLVTVPQSGFEVIFSLTSSSAACRILQYLDNDVLPPGGSVPLTSTTKLRWMDRSK